MRLLLQGNRESTRTLGYLGVDVLYCRYRPTDWNMQCCGERSFEAPVTVIVILGVVAAATGAEDCDFPRCLAIILFPYCFFKSKYTPFISSKDNTTVAITGHALSASSDECSVISPR